MINREPSAKMMRDVGPSSICALLLTVPLTFCGCEKASSSDQTTPPPSTPASRSTEPSTSNNAVTTTNAEKPSEDTWSYASFSDRTSRAVGESKRLGNAAITKSQETSNAALAKSRELWKSALNSSETVIVTVGHKAGAYVNSGGVYIDKSIRMIAIDPSDGISNQEKAKKMALQMIPLVSSVKRYSDARATYEYAHRIEDEATRTKTKQDARRQCLTACVDLGFDITIIGAAGKIEQVAQFGDMALTGVKVTAPVGKLLGVDVSNIDLLNMALDRALAYSTISNTMDEMLCFDLTKIVDVSAKVEE